MALIQTIGRRKSSIARVLLNENGSGEITVNKKPLKEYFKSYELLYQVMRPLRVLEVENKFDFKIKASGGGNRGQAEAARLGIARALEKNNPDNRPALKKEGLLSRDPRVVERKKYGQKKARKKFQFSKR